MKSSKGVAEDDSEINWVDNEGEMEMDVEEQDADFDGVVVATRRRGEKTEQPLELERSREQVEVEDGDDDDECGFDLRSTGSASKLLGGEWRSRQGISGNQKRIKLNSNYREDAEIDAFNRRRVGGGKNKGVCDWAKVPRNVDSQSGGGRQREQQLEEMMMRGATVLEDRELSRDGDGALLLERQHLGSNCGSSGNNNNNPDSNDDANDRERGPARDVGVPEDELETVILRLSSGGSADEGATLTTSACVT